MFSHLMVGADDVGASKRFYDAVLGALGRQPGQATDAGRVFYTDGNTVFALGTPKNGEAASHGNGSTIGFAAASQEEVDAWHDAGIANGGTTCEDPPGVRQGSFGPIYLAYLRDPAGNKLCALHRLKA